MIEWEILSIKIFLVKVGLQNCSREMIIIDSVSKTNPWTYKIKN